MAIFAPLIFSRLAVSKLFSKIISSEISSDSHNLLLKKKKRFFFINKFTLKTLFVIPAFLVHLKINLRVPFKKFCSKCNIRLDFWSSSGIFLKTILLLLVLIFSQNQQVQYSIFFDLDL